MSSILLSSEIFSSSQDGAFSLFSVASWLRITITGCCKTSYAKKYLQSERSNTLVIDNRNNNKYPCKYFKNDEQFVIPFRRLKDIANTDSQVEMKRNQRY